MTKSKTVLDEPILREPAKVGQDRRVAMLAKLDTPTFHDKWAVIGEHPSPSAARNSKDVWKKLVASLDEYRGRVEFLVDGTDVMAKMRAAV